ncbi:AAA family ATPase [Prescottella equi]|uniref:AAA family ATPase n=1 Tax=Rhodococcus hoagii TaxID=43767 RepID=A0A9Q2Z1X2_RHOHA|nr:AAA family ATPase [Prescottella equi]GBF14827.1 septum site-determining protein MinD [Rhodococcus sp. Br-6]AVP68280.1 pilus assembly protein CpaE [Prescottella equi]MBM4474811.1 AAA family ATPase [Prescottella equi]MBM4476874.1 AAA family ATPase [Prescottella equi]MBM4476883.1 AAA family ATPase [Prescottella equi]
MTRIVLLTARDDFARRVYHAADGNLLVLPAQPVPRGPAQLVGLGVTAQPEVLILGPDVVVDEALVLASRIDQSTPGTTVVLASDAGTDVWLRAMRAGVRDVMSPEADMSDVRAVLDRAGQAALARRQRASAPSEQHAVQGKVIVVASPKGGTGKTTVATNLAVGLAAAAPHSTVLVDLDVQFGDVASALQLVPEHCLTDAVSGSASHDMIVLKTVLTPHSTGLYALCGSDSPAAGDSISGEQVTTLLAQLASEFRYVIVDTAPGLLEHTLAALDLATDIVLVSGMDVPSVRGMHKELQLLAELNLAQVSRHVVLNFADRREGLTVQDIQNTIGLPADVVLKRSKAVALSTNRGVPLLQNPGRDRTAKELRRLVGRIDPAPEPPTGKRARHRAAEAVGAK